MNRIEKWLFRRIVSKNTVQGYQHLYDEMIAVIVDETKSTYSEDNDRTVFVYIVESILKAIDK